MESAVPSWPVKHNWRYIARETPPKRAASERVCDFDEIYGLFDEATARAQASRCINCPDPLCVKSGCPLANRIPEWLTLTAEGRFLEAAALSRSTSNMPEICSRVCPQDRLCESACILNARSEPVSIGAVEKFIGLSVIFRLHQPAMLTHVQIERKMSFRYFKVRCSEVCVRWRRKTEVEKELMHRREAVTAVHAGNPQNSGSRAGKRRSRCDTSTTGKGHGMPSRASSKRIPLSAAGA